MRIAYPLFCAALLVVSASPSYSAEHLFQLSEVTGKVLVKTTLGTSSATVGQRLAAGTRIFVGDDSAARITTIDGSCDVILPTQKVSIINQALCEPTITPTATESGPSGVPPPAVGLAFFGTAAIVTGIILAQKKDDPVSPP
jgi:hypothetical protein